MTVPAKPKRAKTSQRPEYSDPGGYRDRQAELSRQASRNRREVGTDFPVHDPERRERGRKSLEAFCLEYFPDRFPLAFSDAHRAAIRRLEGATEGGGRVALAMMRGGGKTTLAEVAVLRAVLYGFRRFAVLVQATQPLAGRSLKKIQRELEQNDRLWEDFRAVCEPVRALERNVVRARMQTSGGEPTLMEWTADMVVLPTVRGSAASGAVLYVTGLTGAVRGLSYASPDGGVIRPDLVLLDDVQTRESAKSPTQTTERESIITDDVLGLAGPTTEIAAVMLCTPIYPNDLSERFLNPDRHPDWSGQRTRMLERMPDDLDRWDRYAEARREAMRSGVGRDEANRVAAEFYLADRAAMDAGAVATWAERVKPGEVSAVQSAMNLYLDNPRGFWAEYQCDAEKAQPQTGAKGLAADDVAGRLSGTDRLVVPRECDRLTAFIDVGGGLHWYAVVAWDGRFGGTVVDYGCWPRQARGVFAATDARPSLADRFGSVSESERVYAGLGELTAAVLGREYPREGAGGVRVSRCLIDAGWQADTVHRFVRASPFAATLFASKGVGRSATQVGVARWKPRPGERSGYHWRLTVGDRGARLVQFDPDAWKTFLWDRLATPLGGAGAVTLFGSQCSAHALVSEHCAAEYAEPVEMKGDRFDKWQVRPDRPDNHLWDCLVGACVAASVDGLAFHPGGQPPAGPAGKIRLSELQAKRRQAAGAR